MTLYDYELREIRAAVLGVDLVWEGAHPQHTARVQLANTVVYVQSTCTDDGMVVYRLFDERGDEIGILDMRGGVA